MDTGGRRCVLGLEDLLLQYHGKDKNFEWYRYINKGIPNDYHKKSRRDRVHNMHRYIVQQLFEMMIIDIIENHVQLDIHLGKEVILSLLIADRERKSNRYRYIIEKRGHDFIPYCINSKWLLKRTSHAVYFRLHKTRWIRLQKQINQGKEYEMAPALIKI